MVFLQSCPNAAKMGDFAPAHFKHEGELLKKGTPAKE